MRTHQRGTQISPRQFKTSTPTVQAGPMQFGRSACILATILALALVGCRREVPSSRPPVAELVSVDRLLELMGKRLDLMHDVARYKWNERKPIADPEREKQLLDGIVEKSRGGDVDPEWVRSFFTAQIEAAKVIQLADFDLWKASNQDRFLDPPDLAVIRKQIDQLNEELLVVMRAAVPEAKRNPITAIDRRIDAMLGARYEAEARSLAAEPMRRLAAP